MSFYNQLNSPTAEPPSSTNWFLYSTATWSKGPNMYNKYIPRQNIYLQRGGGLQQPLSNQLMGAAQCVPREGWKPNELTECASERRTERLLVAENLLSVTHTHTHTSAIIYAHTTAIIYAHTHIIHAQEHDETVTQTHMRIEMNQLAGDRHQRDRERWREMEGASERKHESSTRCVPEVDPRGKCNQDTFTLRHFQGGWRWPEANPSRHSGWIMCGGREGQADTR